MNSLFKISAGCGIALAVFVACSPASQQAGDRSGTLESSITPDNPDAVLSPRANLQRDTIEAATHDRRTSKIAYIGTWASSAQGCSNIDQNTYDGFAVITTRHIRTFEEVCQIDAKPMSSNPETFTALCSAEGQGYKSKMTIEMLNGQSMKLRHEGTSGFNLIRCHLQN